MTTEILEQIVEKAMDNWSMDRIGYDMGSYNHDLRHKWVSCSLGDDGESINVDYISQEGPWYDEDVKYLRQLVKEFFIQVCKVLNIQNEQFKIHLVAEERSYPEDAIRRNFTIKV